MHRRAPTLRMNEFVLTSSAQEGRSWTGTSRRVQIATSAGAGLRDMYQSAATRHNSVSTQAK